tara:strand:+ start:165 stop:707 length:543 start_codon:yes stop_codon:yes gene_type:complete
MVADLTKNKIIIDKNLYKWHKIWGRMQKSFFSDPHELHEKVKIEQFIKEKSFKKVFHIKDNYINFNFDTVQSINEADLVLITDQKFSRSTCKQIIINLKSLLKHCPNIFLCLNRHYLNITGMEIDDSLSNDYELAIHEWLGKSLKLPVINYSEKFIDDGCYYTWVIPDQKFYIKNENYKA